MRLSHQIEAYVYERRRTRLADLVERFGVGEERLRDELAALGPFGVRVTADDEVLVCGEDDPLLAATPAASYRPRRRNPSRRYPYPIVNESRRPDCWS